MNFDELLRDLAQDDDDKTEDRTLYIRESPGGETVDFEVVERTKFDGGYVLDPIRWTV